MIVPLIRKLFIRDFSNTNVRREDTISGCGRACVEILLKRHGIRIDPSLIPPARTLRTMKDISDFMKKNSFLTQGVKFNNFSSLLFFHQSNNSCIILLLEWSTIFKKQIKHWVILEEIDHDQIILLDPALGKVCLTTREFQKKWKGYALILRKG